MLLEGTEKNTIIGECRIIVLSFLLTERREHVAEYDGMMAASLLYIMYIWMEEQIIEVVERQLTGSTIRLAARTGTLHASVRCALHYKNSSCIVTSTLCKISITRCTCETCILLVDFATVGQRPSVYSIELIHRRILLH
jgi:hypothetical protein